jgi:Ca-activated chloride channel family protein
MPGRAKMLFSMLRYHTTMFSVLRPLFGVFVCSTLAFAQTKDFTLRVEVPVVSLDVSVTTETGQPVEGLTPEDFEIYENGVRQDIRYFGSSTAPYHVYLLFDSSGSTRHKWNFMRRAVAGLLGYVKPQDRISIGIFDGGLETLTEWDDPREEALGALDPLVTERESGGTTEFYKSLEKVLEKSFSDIRERRAVIVLTDGRDTSLYREIIRRNRVMDSVEDRRFRGLFKAAGKEGIPVHFIAINTDRNIEGNTRGADEYRNLQFIYKNSAVPEQYLEQVRERMEKVAEVSGGRVLFPRTIEDVIPLYEEIGKDLGRAYSLGYVPATETPGEGLRRIVVRVGNEEYQILQSRAGYYAKQ